MKMPGLDNAVKHERMAPLAEPLGEKIITDPDNLAEKAALVVVGRKLLEYYAVYHHASLFVSL
jgi:hypothetical protein